MSALFGLVSLGPTKVTPGVLASMRDRMRHRGPDGGAIWCEGEAGLGHLMLHTTPESFHEHLPLVHASGDFVLTADLRLDNREELLRDLGVDQARWAEMGDAELVLETWLKHRDKTPARLLGDFAFAIWDESRRTLFAARDHFGVKPFYYHHSQKGFVAFATEIRGLFSVPGVPRELNGPRFADYLIEGYHLNPADHPDTFYKGLFRLPPGSTLTYTPDGLRIKRYWRLEIPEQLNVKSDAEYNEAFRHHFKEAVSCRMRVGVKLGAQLSGGLDSSAVVCQARELAKANGQSGLIPTFSCVYPDFPQCDETSYIDAVVNQGGVSSTRLRMDTAGPLSVRDRFFAGMDEGDLGTAAQHLMGMNEACVREGVRVVLDGLDGDTTVGHGHHYFTELARSGRWEEFQVLASGFQQAGFDPTRLFDLFAAPYFKELGESGALRSLYQAYSGASRHLSPAPKSLLAHHTLRPLIPLWFKRAIKPLRTAPPTRENIASELVGRFLSPDFAERIGLQKRLTLLRGRQKPAAKSESESQWRTLSGCGLTFTLELHDQMSGSAGTEGWHPFMDKRLIEFCLAVPGSQKVRNGFERWILRDSLRGILPAAVAERRDKGMMTENFHSGFVWRDGDAVLPFLMAKIDSGDKGFNWGFLMEHFSTLRSGKAVRSEDIFAAYRMVSGSMWLDLKALR